VVDAIRGLQYDNHRIDRSDQEVRSNMILAGEDAVATDALAAHLMGYQSSDIEFLHMASKRQMGTMDLRDVEVIGDEPDLHRRKWGKPRDWHGRCNRQWLLTQDPAADLKTWARFTSPVDTLHFGGWQRPSSASPVYKSAVRVVADGNRKAFLWVGARGHVTAFLNGERVLAEEGTTGTARGSFRRL